MLENNSDNMVVFDLGKPIFVMEFLVNVLSNDCKAGVMYVKSNYGMVYIDVTSSNIQRRIAWTKKYKG